MFFFILRFLSTFAVCVPPDLIFLFDVFFISWRSVTIAAEISVEKAAYLVFLSVITFPGILMCPSRQFKLTVVVELGITS